MAAARVFDGQVRSRAASAISASATTQRARATASGAEGAGGASQECVRASEIAELRHGDAAQRQRWRIVTQGYPVEGAQGITAARARAAAVISESIAIPSRLSLSSFDIRS